MTRPLRIMIATSLMASAVLASEIILTRIFSVLLWYHFAFLAISTCLFGLGLGSLILHLLGSARLREDDLPKHLGYGAFGFAFSQCVCVLVLRFAKLGSLDFNLVFITEMAIVFLVCAAPFVFAGFFLGLVFSRGAGRIGALYFADLAGAAAGCLLTIGLLTLLGGAAALLATAVIALIAGMIACPANRGKENFAAQGILALMIVAVLAANHFTGFLIFHYTKGNEEPDPIAVEWNSFSRVIAYNRPKIGDVMLEIDGIANTPITPFHGDVQATQDPMGNLQRLPYEFYDKPSLLVIGSGGGEHILTGLAAGAGPIVGIEMNPIVIDMVENRFRHMAGGLFHQPGVRVELAEGRSYTARTKERFDIINFTLVDTWAATAGGAFALTENFLFTTNAFEEYFDHLTGRGMLAIKRWRDAEEYHLRMAALARSVLEKRGEKNPENCLFAVADAEFINILIKQRPFMLDEIHRLHNLAEKLELDLLYSPFFNEGNEELRTLLRSRDLSRWLDKQERNLAPPTDDKPFFFHTLRFRDLPGIFKLGWSAKIRNLGSLILVTLLGIVVFFVGIMILGPLVFVRKHRVLLAGNLRSAAFFALIGAGFLIVEIAMMQSFILYLGHPTLTLTVFLATLLVASAIGSAASSRIGPDRPKRAVIISVIALVGVALALRSVSPKLFAATLGLPTVSRAMITAVVLFPLGFLMGFPFPLGVRAVREDETVPWMFAVNSAASVLGSVAAVTIALAFGFTFAASVGLAAYICAIFAYPADDV